MHKLKTSLFPSFLLKMLSEISSSDRKLRITFLPLFQLFQAYTEILFLRKVIVLEALKQAKNKTHHLFQLAFRHWKNGKNGLDYCAVEFPSSSEDRAGLK